MTIEELLLKKESESNIEFKEAKNNYSYNGAQKQEAKDRRRCLLGYVVALANEGGGILALGIKEGKPHTVVGTKFCENEEGKLTARIYNDLKIRVSATSLFNGKKQRVLVIKIPARPIGIALTFEDIPLMRIGDQLSKMSDAQYHKIITEQEPDFSFTLCQDLKIDDLDTGAIQKMKEMYSLKQGNNSFLSLDNTQALSDLDLIRDNKLTFAALILLGKKESIKTFLPQATSFIEYRSSQSSITFEAREVFDECFFISIDKIWQYINLRNSKFPIQEGPYILDIPQLNEEVVREAVNNAFAHRDYRRASEIVIKQYHENLIICSPGGFPVGVTQENILTVNSTPRNRLLTDILLKTGIVERSGQGVDKMFRNSILEAKGTPDYSESDNYQVILSLPSLVTDKAFYLFLNHIRTSQNIDLTLDEIIILEKIRKKGPPEIFNKKALRSLIDKNMIESVGKTKGISYILSKEYYDFTNQSAKYTLDKGLNSNSIFYQIAIHFETFKSAKMNDFMELFSGKLNREQIKYHVSNFVKQGLLIKKGRAKGSVYKIGDKVIENGKIAQRAMQIGLAVMKKRGEIPEE